MNSSNWEEDEPWCWMMPLGTQRMTDAVFMIICFFLLVLISERCLLHSLCRYGMGDVPPIPSWFGCPANMNVTIVNYILASGFSLAPFLVALVWSVGKLAPRTKWRGWLKIYLMLYRKTEIVVLLKKSAYSILWLVQHAWNIGTRGSYLE